MFTTCFETYAFIRMPFGLKNAPTSCQRAIETISTSVKWQLVLVYLDEIIVFRRPLYNAKLTSVGCWGSFNLPT